MGGGISHYRVLVLSQVPPWDFRDNVPSVAKPLVPCENKASEGTGVQSHLGKSKGHTAFPQPYICALLCEQCGLGKQMLSNTFIIFK